MHYEKPPEWIQREIEDRAAARRRIALLRLAVIAMWAAAIVAVPLGAWVIAR